MTLGEQIKQVREAKNFSQEELAERLGVSRQAVSKWENGSSVPQGANREMLSQVLGLELSKSEAPLQSKGWTWFGWLGWIAASICFILFLSAATGNSETGALTNGSSEQAPAIKSVTFYDSEQNKVEAEALWYNAARIECILIQWEGGVPDNIKVFSTPSGTDTTEMTELLLTKSVSDGDSVELLNGAPLKNIVQSHVVFALDLGENMVSSEIYNIFYDENAL